MGRQAPEAENMSDMKVVECMHITYTCLCLYTYICICQRVHGRSKTSSKLVVVTVSIHQWQSIRSQLETAHSAHLVICQESTVLPRDALLLGKGLHLLLLRDHNCHQKALQA